MKQLSQLVENEKNTGQIYYAYSPLIPLQPTRIRLVAYNEILNEEAFNTKPKDLLAVIVDESGEIPISKKFKTIPTFYKNGVVLFDTYEECNEHFSRYWKVSSTS